jgi:hypothetical protein
VVAFIGLWTAAGFLVFEMFFILFTSANPMMTNALDIEVYEKCDAAFRGRFNAICVLADKLVGVLVLGLCKVLMDKGLADMFYIWSIPLIFITLFFVVRSRRFLSKEASLSTEAGFHQ